jgi:hypothetical protein
LTSSHRRGARSSATTAAQPTAGGLVAGEPVAGLRGRRRRPRAYRLLPIALGIGVLGIGAMAAGPSVIGKGVAGGFGREQISYASLPKDARDLGLVYDGLQSGVAGSLCAGAYQLDETTCTHGPDTAPAGLKVNSGVAPVTAKAADPVAPQRETADVPPDAEIVRDEGGVALAADQPALIPDPAPGDADFVMGTHDVACEGDGRTGKRVQVLYLHEFGTPSRYTEFLGSMRTWSAGVDQIFDASAAETGGSRHVRFVTTPQCRVDVAEVQVPQGALQSFHRNIDALTQLGYNRSDRKYLIFADSSVYCGIGTFMADSRKGQNNRNNGGPSYGRVDAGCWGSQMAAHELTQTLGASLQGSPHSTGAGSCTDDYDLLCGPDRSKAAIHTVCPKSHENRLDCGHDDYFSTNPRPGSYLADNWNVANSEFLLHSDGGDDIPDAPNAPAGTPATPDTSATGAQPDPTSGGPADGGGDAPPVSPEATRPSAVPVDPAAEQVQAVLEVRDPTSTAVHLTWSAAAPGASYDVAVNGVKIASTAATRAQLIGLRPDTKYAVTIADAKDKYLAKGTAQAAPAARPAQNSWFVLTNSLTGGAADLYAARTANGTPLTLGESDGDAQEQWRLVPVGNTGTFTLQSKATGKCVTPLGNNPVAGAPLLQDDCADTTQRWQLQLSPNGFTLKTADADLVAGVGVQRFGVARVLVLQNADGARHQSWTAVPG